MPTLKVLTENVRLGEQEGHRGHRGHRGRDGAVQDQRRIQVSIL
jgi:hypothetical protein